MMNQEMIVAKLFEQLKQFPKDQFFAEQIQYREGCVFRTGAMVVFDPAPGRGAWYLVVTSKHAFAFDAARFEDDLRPYLTPTTDVFSLLSRPGVPSRIHEIEAVHTAERGQMLLTDKVGYVYSLTPWEKSDHAVGAGTVGVLG